MDERTNEGEDVTDGFDWRWNLRTRADQWKTVADLEGSLRALEGLDRRGDRAEPALIDACSALGALIGKLRGLLAEAETDGSDAP